MKKEVQVNMEQYVSGKTLENVDHVVLQTILKMVKSANMKNDDMIIFQLNGCPHCQKQRIFLVDAAQDNYNSEICMLSMRKADERVVVYQYEASKQVICLESEAEALIKVR